MDMKIPGSREILQFHDNWLAQPDWDAESPAAQAQGVWSHIEHNHRCNCRLWKEEDQARRRNVPDSAIAANKRNIDAFNQQRNDSIEKMDECLLAQLAEVELNAAVRLHSESAGSMIDRLSILALKVFHMRIQTERADAPQAHIETSRKRLARLVEQRTDLAACFGALLGDCLAGRARFKVYRQFKMYNDPAFNPYLYGTKSG
ncbi:MAG TPA: DUF4254 domain-containing protein [Burkholderiales bacterium]|nr:DUF4254 domain-containing protein [Burkholderiales bacterium]